MKYEKIKKKSGKNTFRGCLYLGGPLLLDVFGGSTIMNLFSFDAKRYYKT